MNRQSTPLDVLQSMFPQELRSNLFDIISSTVTDNTPPVNAYKISTTVCKSNNRVIIYAEMPGFEKKSIDVDFYNNSVEIIGHKPSPVLLDDEKTLNCNIKYGSFYQKLQLPISVTNRQNVNVKYVDGILTIIINLASEERNRFKVNLTSPTVTEESPLNTLD